MAYVKRAMSPSIKMGGSNRPQQARAPIMLPESRLGRAPSLQHAIGCTYGAVLTELHFAVRGEVWTARVKADFGSIPMVAWIDVPSFGKCLEVLCEFAHMGWIPWKLDKRPPRR